MRKERMNGKDVVAHLREQGIQDLREVKLALVEDRNNRCERFQSGNVQPGEYSPCCRGDHPCEPTDVNSTLRCAETCNPT